MKTCVSWEDGFGDNPANELWVRVLSSQMMKPSNVLPDEIASQIPAEVLADFNHRNCQWQPDLRQDDDETVIEWPYEQWWSLPRMRTTA